MLALAGYRRLLKGKAMINPYEKLGRAVGDLMEFSNWIEIVCKMEEGETAYVSEYELEGERYQSSFPLEDGTVFLADIQPELIESYSWDHADRLIEAGETPLAVALAVSCGISTLIMLEIIRAVDALPADCVWREGVRRDLRLRFVEAYPFCEAFFFDRAIRIKNAREFLGVVVEIEKEFALKLASLTMLEEELAVGKFSPINRRFSLQENDFELLRAMKELRADICVQPAVVIMQKANRTGAGKHAFTRLLVNNLVESSPKGYRLTSLGLATANGS